MIGKILWVSMVLASAALLLGYILGGLWIWTPAILALGALWMVGERRRWRHVASLGLVLHATVAAMGMALGLGAGWMLLGVVGSLAAWDLGHFVETLRDAGRVEGARQLEREHLRRLVLVAGLGLLLGALALSVQSRLSFWMVMFLGLVGILSLSRVVAYLRIEGD